MPWAPEGKERRMVVPSSQPVGGYFLMREEIWGRERRCEERGSG